MPRFRHHWPALLVFALALAIYLRTLCPTVFVEGTGENIVCAWTLSVPHPPGFPLFCLLGKAFAELVRVGAIAYRINLFSAVMGAVAVAALYLLLGALGIGRLAAAAAALTFAFSATLWRQATIAEVYTLSLAVIILQIALLVRWRWSLVAPSPAAPPKRKPRTEPEPRQGRQPSLTTRLNEVRFGRPVRTTWHASLLDALLLRTPPSDRPLLWFAFAFGLGLTVHYNHILLLPAYLYFVTSHDPTIARRGRTWVKGFLLAAVGFALHLYAPIRAGARPPINWGDPGNLSNWWRYLTAEQYRGRMFHLSLAQVAGNLGRFVADLPSEFWWLGLVAALGGALVLFRRDRRLFWTTAIIVTVVVIWTINYDIPWEINVYYLQALLAFTIWAAFGLQWLAGRLARARLRFAALVVFAAPAALIAANFRPNDLSGQTFVLDNARDVARSAGSRGALVLPATNPTFAVLYLRHVEEQLSGFALWSQTEHGIVPTDQAVQPGNTPAVVDAPLPPLSELLRPRPGFPTCWVDRQPQSALFGLTMIPWGSLYRAVPVAKNASLAVGAPTPTPPPFDIAGRPFRYGAEERLIACRYLLVQGDYAWEHGDQAQADRCYREVNRIGGSLPEIPAQLGMRYAEQGRTDLAIETYRKAIARKDDALLRNRLGAIYGRQNRLAEAEEQFRRAITLKADFAEAHANLGSVYGRMGKIEDAVRETEQALALDPFSLLALRNLGFGYAQMGRTNDARRLLQRALDLDPNQDDVRNLLRGL